MVDTRRRHAKAAPNVVTLPGEIDMAKADWGGEDVEAVRPGVGVVVAGMPPSGSATHRAPARWQGPMSGEGE